jgi:hypothetical protein
MVMPLAGAAAVNMQALNNINRPGSEKDDLDIYSEKINAMRQNSMPAAMRWSLPVELSGKGFYFEL